MFDFYLFFRNKHLLFVRYRYDSLLAVRAFLFLDHIDESRSVTRNVNVRWFWRNVSCHCCVGFMMKLQRFLNMFDISQNMFSFLRLLHLRYYFKSVDLCVCELHFLHKWVNLPFFSVKEITLIRIFFLKILRSPTRSGVYPHQEFILSSLVRRNDRR